VTQAPAAALLSVPLQDFLTCAFLVTAKDTFFARSEMCALIAYMSDATDPVDLVRLPSSHAQILHTLKNVFLIANESAPQTP
jgi:hypothetical protein